MATLDAFPLSPIGVVSSPFKQKFAIPRQPALANAKAEIHFYNDYNDINCFRDISGYSHLWVLFLFHQNLSQGWQPTVRAPRLGGNRRTGVFASRTTFRPNGIGMSVVKNLGLEQSNGAIRLKIGAVDLLEGTPVIDIKPYLPYTDCVADAHAMVVEQHPMPNRAVVFTHTAKEHISQQPHADLHELIVQCLQQDPRPAYRQTNEDDSKQYRVTLYDRDISWTVQSGKVIVLAIEPVVE